MPWRDIKLYLQALAKHWVSVAVGPAATLLLLFAEEVFKIDIPRSVLGLAAVVGVLVAGFKAWQDEHAEITPQEDVEEQRRLRALADKMVDEYVALARPRRDAGPHALATLGLHALKSDALIREAIREMDARSGVDPWSGQLRSVEDVDLVKFFELVHQMRFDFLRDGTVGGVAQKVREAGGHRPTLKDRLTP